MSPMRVVQASCDRHQIGLKHNPDFRVNDDSQRICRMRVRYSDRYKTGHAVIRECPPCRAAKAVWQRRTTA